MNGRRARILDLLMVTPGASSIAPGWLIEARVHFGTDLKHYVGVSFFIKKCCFAVLVRASGIVLCVGIGSYLLHRVCFRHLNCDLVELLIRGKVNCDGRQEQEVTSQNKCLCYYCQSHLADASDDDRDDVESTTTQITRLDPNSPIKTCSQRLNRKLSHPPHSCPNPVKQSLLKGGCCNNTGIKCNALDALNADAESCSSGDDPFAESPPPIRRTKCDGTVRKRLPLSGSAQPTPASSQFDCDAQSEASSRRFAWDLDFEDAGDATVQPLFDLDAVNALLMQCSSGNASLLDQLPPTYAAQTLRNRLRCSSPAGSTALSECSEFSVAADRQIGACTEENFQQIQGDLYTLKSDVQLLDVEYKAMRQTGCLFDDPSLFYRCVVVDADAMSNASRTSAVHRRKQRKSPAKERVCNNLGTTTRAQSASRMSRTDTNECIAHSIQSRASPVLSCSPSNLTKVLSSGENSPRGLEVLLDIEEENRLQALPPDAVAKKPSIVPRISIMDDSCSSTYLSLDLRSSIVSTETGVGSEDKFSPECAGMSRSTTDSCYSSDHWTSPIQSDTSFTDTCSKSSPLQPPLPVLASPLAPHFPDDEVASTREDFSNCHSKSETEFEKCAKSLNLNIDLAPVNCSARDLSPASCVQSLEWDDPVSQEENFSPDHVDCRLAKEFSTSFDVPVEETTITSTKLCLLSNFGLGFIDPRINGVIRVLQSKQMLHFVALLPPELNHAPFAIVVNMASHGLKLFKCRNLRVIHEAVELSCKRYTFFSHWQFHEALGFSGISTSAAMISCLDHLWELDRFVRQLTRNEKFDPVFIFEQLDMQGWLTDRTCLMLTESCKVLMLLKAIEVLEQIRFTRQPPLRFYTDLLHTLHAEDLVTHLNQREPTCAFSDLDLALLADAFGVRLEVYRLTGEAPNVAAVYPDKSVVLPRVALLQLENARGYLPLLEAVRKV